MAIYLAPTSDLLDTDEAGQYLPAELTFEELCEEKEAMLVQSKLDIIIAELKQVKDVLCKRKEKVSNGTGLHGKASTPASTSSLAASAASGELEMAIFRSTQSPAHSACNMDALPPPDEIKPLLKH